MAKELKEENRLAATVKLIQEEAAVVPRGACFRRADGRIVANAAFQGLTRREALRLESYLHARPPRDKRLPIDICTRSDYDYALDYLDSIDSDAPKGCWSLWSYHAESLVILRNMFWPGMAFYHEVDTPRHGYMYVGNGKKNLDLPFALISTL